MKTPTATAIVVALLLSTPSVFAQTQPHPTSGLFGPAKPTPVVAKPATPPQPQAASVPVNATPTGKTAQQKMQFAPITVVKTPTYQKAPTGPVPAFPVLAKRVVRHPPTQAKPAAGARQPLATPRQPARAR